MVFRGVILNVLDQATKYAIEYIISNVDKEVSIKINNDELYEKLSNIIFQYSLLTCLSDIFIETTNDSIRFSNLCTSQTRDTSTNSSKSIKKDLNRILKNIAEIEEIYHRNYVGEVIDKVISDKQFNQKAIFKELGKLEFICQEALRFYSPEQGRTPSKERIGRIHMVAEIIRIFQSLKLPHGSGTENSFYVFIVIIYEILKIEVTTPNRDIKEAKKLLTDEKI